MEKERIRGGVMSTYTMKLKIIRPKVAGVNSKKYNQYTPCPKCCKKMENGGEGAEVLQVDARLP